MVWPLRSYFALHKEIVLFDNCIGGIKKEVNSTRRPKKNELSCEGDWKEGEVYSDKHSENNESSFAADMECEETRSVEDSEDETGSVGDSEEDETGSVGDSKEIGSAKQKEVEEQKGVEEIEVSFFQ